MKKVIAILSIIILLLIGIFGYLGIEQKHFDKKENNFYEAIKCIKNGEYANAVNLSKNLENKNDERTIKSILSYLFHKEVANFVSKTGQQTSYSDSIISEAVIDLSIYGTCNITDLQQEKINQYNLEAMKSLEAKERFDKSMLYEDLGNYYDVFFQTVESFNGLESNLKQKLLNTSQREKLVEDMQTYAGNASKLTEEMKVLTNSHPLEEIPEEYIIMFELDK